MNQPCVLLITMSSNSPPGHAASAEDPWIQIILFDLSKPRRISDESVVWHPSDALKGHILITAKAEIEFDEIQIYFEGDRSTLDKHGRISSLTSASLFRNLPDLYDVFL